MLPVSIVVWASTGEARLDSEQASKNVKATTLHERSDACDGADIFFATDTARMVASLSCEKNRTKHWKLCGSGVTLSENSWLRGQPHALQQVCESGISMQAIELWHPPQEGVTCAISILIGFLQPAKGVLLVADACVGAG